MMVKRNMLWSCGRSGELFVDKLWTTCGSVRLAPHPV